MPLAGCRLERRATQYRRCVIRVFGAAIALLLIGAIYTESARAGMYVMRNCSVPGYEASLLGPWFWEDQSGMKIVDACASGGSVGFTFSGERTLPKNGSLSVVLSRPSGAQSAIGLVKAVVWYNTRMGGSGSPLTVFTEIDTPGMAASLRSVVGPSEGDNLVLETDLDPSVPMTYRIGIWCGWAVPSTEECHLDQYKPLEIRGMAVTLKEDVSPLILSLGGTVLDGGPQSGIRTVTYAASDLQAGLARVDVLLGSTVVASRVLTTRCSYVDFTVCPPSDDATLAVDTRIVANGAQSLTLRVRDAAGNEVSKRAASAIDVANSQQASVGTSPSGAQLTAEFERSSRSSLTVPYGRPVKVTGRLTGIARRAIGGVRIEVRERLPGRRQGTRRWRRADRSRRDLSYALRRYGPSRRVRLTYSAGGGAEASSREITLRVRAAASLKAALRGVLVRYGGRVVSGPIPRSGKRVLLEGRAKGFAWTRFAVARTDQRGRFAGRYRLAVRRPGVRLQVRVVVPTERSYPYLSYTGRPIVLRVR